MNILFLGHSLIEFYDWQERFPAHKAVNLGVAGETVEGLLSRIDRITKEHPSADLIFIMTGLNNIAMDDFDFFGSYKKILEKLSPAYPSAKIFMNSILPVIVDFISNESIKNVNESLKGLAKETGVEFLDIYKLFLDGKGRVIKEYFLDDGVHLSAKGYEVWAKAVEEVIEQML
ncbi:MAG: GDSL-type esterase/lipase family protein [Thermodesulfovibrionales bacterium]|nr:GDSL-type esterase/lipase family protein [Thermodesulfovibrionales bacterium]